MTLTTQFYTLVAMIGMGCYFGASLDTYQYFLNRPKRKRIIVFIHDLLFWFVQALFIFYVLFLVNEGELRFYSFLGLICGFAAYQSLFKKMYMYMLHVAITICVAIANFSKKVCTFTIVRPIVGIIKMIIYFIKMLIKFVKMTLLVILKIVKVLFIPIVWLIRQFYKMLPNIFTNKIEKLYNYSKGFFKKIKNTIYIAYKRFLKRNKK